MVNVLIAFASVNLMPKAHQYHEYGFVANVSQPTSLANKKTLINISEPAISMNIGQRILWCNSCHFDISILAQLNDYIGGLLHLGPNVITFRALLHLGPNVIKFRTVITFRTSTYASPTF